MNSLIVSADSYMEPDSVRQRDRSAQNLAGIREYSEDGIFRFRNGKYGRCYRMEESNYDMEDDAGQDGLLSAFCDFLNRQSGTFKVFFYNRKVDAQAILERRMFQMKQDPWDHVRKAYNEVFEKTAKEKEGIVKERYVVVSTDQKRRTAAENHFRLQDDAVRKDMVKLHSAATPLLGDSWLRLLHSVFHPGQESSYVTSMAEKKVNFRNQIAPMYLLEKEDYLKTESLYYRVMTIRTLPSGIPDNILYRIADFDAMGFVTVDYSPMPAAEGKALLEQEVMRNDDEIGKQQRVRNKAGEFTTEISRPVKQKQAKLKKLLNAMDMNDSRLFFLNILIVVTGEDLDSLNQVTEQVKENVSECGAEAEILYMQQKEGFISALPVPIREVRASHGLLTEAAVGFIPFSALDLDIRDGVFYGVNQLTGRGIWGARGIDRANMANGHMLIIGPSGTGKGFIVKSELVQNYLRYPDAYFYILDPQGEYDNIVAMAGGETYRFSPGSEVMLNPFACNLEGKNEKEISDIIHGKESLALALLELADGGRQIGGVQQSILDEAVRKAFDSARETGAEVLPQDIREEIFTDTPAGEEVARLWDVYCTGLLRFFNGRSNIRTDARVVSYNLRDLNANTRRAVMMVLLEVLEEQISMNYSEQKTSFMICDELDKLTDLESSQERLAFAWKLYRKLDCHMCGMFQNTSIFSRKPLLSDLNENTFFKVLTKMVGKDLVNARELLNLTNAELSYVQEAEIGTGLILYGNKHIAYRNQFTEEENPLLYDLFNTDADSRKKRLGKQPGTGEDSLFYRLAHEEFKEGQLQQLRLAVREGIPENQILEFFHADVPEWEMARSREMFCHIIMQEKQDADECG